MKMRAVLFASLLIACAVATPIDWRGQPKTASASVSIAVSLDELIQRSDAIVVAKAAEYHSRWIEFPHGRRIATFTRFEIEDVIAGKPPSTLWVRTLGGIVDNIGQSVSGEARFKLGDRSLLFLHATNDGSVVTASAQGHFVIVTENHVDRLTSSPDVGAVLPRSGPSVSARERLLQRTLSDARSLITQAASKKQ